MSRPFKYPEILELKVGESFYLPKTHIESLTTLRVIVSRMAKSKGLVLSLHDNWREGVVEITRLSSRTPIKGVIGPATPRRMSLKETYEEIDRIQAELNAQD